MEPMKLNTSEWNVLNCLWENHPRTVIQGNLQQGRWRLRCFLTVWTWRGF